MVDKGKGSEGGKPKETATIDLTHQSQKGAQPGEIKDKRIEKRTG